PGGYECLDRFNLRRDARPLATLKKLVVDQCHLPVSISDEMPGPWRQDRVTASGLGSKRFNLRRDARPLATLSDIGQRPSQPEFQSQTRCQAPGDRTAVMLLLLGSSV